MNLDEAGRIVSEHVAKLREHFDVVQIMVSWEPDDGSGRTGSVRRGSGNWYARQGLAHEFIAEERADEIGRAVARNKED